MNWYKRAKATIKIAELQGEWWIIDGKASFADGDVGDYNHEAVAIEYAQSLVKDALQEDPILSDVLPIIFGEQGDYENFDPIASRTSLNDWADDMQKSGMLTEEEADDIYETIVIRTGIDHEILDIAFRNLEDARDYAIKKWGWIRVAGNNVETNTLTATDTNNIADGLWDAHEELARSAVYDIYVYSNNRFYTDVPFEDIEKGPMAINPHRTR